MLSIANIDNLQFNFLKGVANIYNLVPTQFLQLCACCVFVCWLLCYAVKYVWNLLTAAAGELLCCVVRQQQRLEMAAERETQQAPESRESSTAQSSAVPK